MKIEKIDNTLENDTTMVETNNHIEASNGAIDSVPESEEYFFEGTEKLLEVWFSSSAPHLQSDLTSIPRCKWEALLKIVNCEILSEVSSLESVAYLLTESSMFVSKEKIILKTCGRTTLLQAVSPLLMLVKEECSMDVVVDVFYSHKNYLRPDLQPQTYQHFDLEVEVLNNTFKDASAYVMGRLNKDCWYVYTLNHCRISKPDQTIEIMMMDVDVGVMEMFTKADGVTAKKLTMKSGIADIFADALIDDWLFEPCGYSMNALIPNGSYFTIHVTPEEKFSYVSFETNVPQSSYKDVVSKVTSIFKPNKFMVTLLANEESPAYPVDFKQDTHLPHYQRSEYQYSEMKNYNLNYALYRSCSASSTFK